MHTALPLNISALKYAKEDFAYLVRTENSPCILTYHLLVARSETLHIKVMLKVACMDLTH